MNDENFGQEGHLTPDQMQTLQSFISECPSEHIQSAKFSAESIESVSLRFLRARQFDLIKAKLLLDEAYKKKQEWKVSELVKCTAEENAHCNIEVLKSWYPHSMPGLDKKNRPILFEHSGGVNPTIIRNITTAENLIHYHWWVMEVALDRAFSVAAEQAVIKGIPMSFSTCVIMDFNGLTTSHCSSKMLDHLKRIVSIDNCCYPEILGKMLVVNAPWLSVGLWNIIKGWLDPRTQAKIEIVSAGADSISKLQQLVDLAQLPTAYGGSGPPFYTPYPNTEALSVPRSGHSRKVVEVPAGHVLSVDSYVSEGVVEFVVAAVATLEPQHHHGKPAAANSTNHHTPGVAVFKAVLTGDSTAPPDRCLFVCPVSDSDRHLVLSWNNSSRFSTRTVVSSFSVIDPATISATATATATAAESAPVSMPETSVLAASVGELEAASASSSISCESAPLAVSRGETETVNHNGEEDAAAVSDIQENCNAGLDLAVADIQISVDNSSPVTESK